MSGKLSKEDQQLEDAGQFVISIFRGMAKGIKVLKKDQQKLIILIIITLICGVFFYLRQNIAAYFIPGVEGFHVLKVMLLLLPIVPFAALYMMGEETVIAASGNTGRSTGPYLHIGIMINGYYVDALPLILESPEK